ncbi:MAG: tRNA (N6-threonylcarbamoyladenosine(37)-N6)-methyltransferase TrmO [Candidatus Bathyarchaeota archaeon]|nr:tRNA (N6-threonylcarbamoyladenosine(37)-N6)-methyltransferase TrmO [Candidatus Bathyarchaeota archaeon]
MNDDLMFIGTVIKVEEDEAEIEIFPQFCGGLKGIEAFSHLFILYWAHLRDDENGRKTLLVFPKRHAVKVETGVFACRSPSRPNPLGLCVVELIDIRGCQLSVRGLDAFKDTPIVDIKPYIPRADSVPHAKVPDWTARGPAT